MTKEEYDKLNFACKTLIRQAKQNIQRRVIPINQSEEDRCKYLTKKGYMTPIMGAWSGEIEAYELI